MNAIPSGEKLPAVEIAMAMPGGKASLRRGEIRQIFL
jgi:hypothetical protein